MVSRIQRDRYLSGHCTLQTKLNSTTLERLKRVFGSGRLSGTMKGRGLPFQNADRDQEEE